MQEGRKIANQGHQRPLGSQAQHHRDPLQACADPAPGCGERGWVPIHPYCQGHVLRRGANFLAPSPATGQQQGKALGHRQTRGCQDPVKWSGGGSEYRHSPLSTMTAPPGRTRAAQWGPLAGGEADSRHPLSCAPTFLRCKQSPGPCPAKPMPNGPCGGKPRPQPSRTWGDPAHQPAGSPPETNSPQDPGQNQGEDTLGMSKE